jgi:23S rRNA (pseudouridine1915-N3)-methyltransferase
MQIKIIALGKRMPSWVNDAYQEFAKRLKPHAKLSLIELNTPKRGKDNNIAKLKQQEAELVKQHLNPGDVVVALDEHGQQWTSPQLAQKLQTWHVDNANLALLIGGPDGLDSALLAQATVKWSLSKLVFAHPLVRVILAEQLYRGFSILSNHPYHRG